MCGVNKRSWRTSRQRGCKDRNHSATSFSVRELYLQALTIQQMNTVQRSCLCHFHLFLFPSPSYQYVSGLCFTTTHQAHKYMHGHLDYNYTTQKNALTLIVSHGSWMDNPMFSLQFRASFTIFRPWWSMSGEKLTQNMRKFNERELKIGWKFRQLFPKIYQIRKSVKNYKRLKRTANPLISVSEICKLIN